MLSFQTHRTHVPMTVEAERLAPHSYSIHGRATKMDFRRSGQLDERRRRVLMDEIASPPAADQAQAINGSAKGPGRAYHAAVLSERQPKVTDLLPVRPLWLVVVLLLGLTGIATIEAIHVHAAPLELKEGS